MGGIEVSLHVCGLLFLWTQSRNHANRPCNSPSRGAGAVYRNGYDVRFSSHTIWLCLPRFAIYWLGRKQSYFNFLCLSFLPCTCGITELSKRSGAKII